MKTSRSIWIAVVSSLVLAGCGEREFGEGKIRYRMETQQTQLDGEQVTLTKAQVACGAQQDLWDIEQLGEDRSVGRLTQNARNVGFGDDVQVEQPGFHNSYVQVRGSFVLSLIQVNNIRDDGPQNKVVDAKVGVRINHSCFDSPLPVLLGVKRGKFNETAGTLVRFHLDGDWMYDQIIH
jgi:hypothetical protein